MRLWFMGSGEFASSCLERMSGQLQFERVITGHPTRAGRGLQEHASAVERAALGLPLERTGPLSQNEKLLKTLTSDPPDLIFVVDFGQLIREPFLSTPIHGCLNIHPSLLPRWRGAAPVQRALLNGDLTTGVTVFRLTEELDAGPILIQSQVSIPPLVDSTELLEILALEGSQIAVRGVKSIIEGSCQFLAQNSELSTYAAKLDKAEAEVSWGQDPIHIHNRVRAFASSTGAFVAARGKRLKLWRTAPVDAQGKPGQILSLAGGGLVVACAGGAVQLVEVQGEGKRRMSGADWARGDRLKAGEGLI
ncbi:MAG: methionyl-tRNA formyltransferase [Synergistaceae bacterium]|jgi:methionyl-tRNA formyltransferase|nr:methionyl-tRNA formyltransferase [Synergistaceae bacterium]